MKNTIICGICLLLSVETRAQQTVSVTPQTLGDWTVIGADSTALGKQSELSLPAGAQLAHSFKSAGLAVKITTSPVIGRDSADFPVLEIGQVALAFGRDSSAGNMTLVVGDNAPIELPFSFSLDASGRSVAPLTVGLALQGTKVTVTAEGKALQFPVPATDDGAIEIVASAGAGLSWDLPDFKVTIADETATARPPSNQATVPSPVGHSEFIAAAMGSPGANTTAQPVGGATKGDQAIAAGGASPPSVITLEIATPPAFRHGRVAAIRAATAQAKRNN